MAPVREQLIDVVRLLVDRGEQVGVEVEEVAEEGETVFHLTVAEEDLGQVIGRQGRTARALRTVLAARAAKSGGEYALEIVED
jgi:uncharacterized protein